MGASKELERMAAQLEAVMAQVDALAESTARLEAENARLRDGAAAPVAARSAPQPAHPDEPPVSRRDLFRKVGIAAAAGGALAVGGSVLSASPAAAATVSGDSATGDGVVGTSGSNSFSGVYGNNTAAGFGVTGRSTNGVAVQAVSSAKAAVLARSDGTAPTVDAANAGNGAAVQAHAAHYLGVYATGPSGGVYGESTLTYGVTGKTTASGDIPAGVLGFAPGAIGVKAQGRIPLVLEPGNHVGPPSGVYHRLGSFFTASDGVVWVCVATGTPGTWVRTLTSGDGSATRPLPAPIRLVDTRGGGAPITNGGARVAANAVLPVQVTGTVVSGISVPVGATGVVGNMAVTGPTGAGYVQVYPGNVASTTTSVLNFAANQTIANSFLAALPPAGATNPGLLRVKVLGAATHVIIDITGYLF